MDTPLLSAIGRGKTKQRYHQWVVDRKRAAAANAVIEGDDAANDTQSPATVYGNYCQLMENVVGISSTVEASDHYGDVNDMDYRIEKAMVELKKDLDRALSQNQASTAGAAASARTMGSIESWLTQYTSIAAAAAKSAATVPGFASGIVAAPTDATGTGTLTETIFKNFLAELYSAGADPTLVLVPPLGKQKISSGFTGVATRNRDYSRNQQVAIIAGADLYVSDFGELAIAASRQMRTRVLLVLDPEYASCDYLQPFRTEDLAKTGHAKRKMCVVEATLNVKDPQAHGQIRDIDFSL